MEITHVDVEGIAEAVLSGIAEEHRVPFEGLFADRAEARESYIKGLRDSVIPPDGLIYKEGDEIKSMAVWLDPAPEAEDLDIAAVRVVSLLHAGSEEDRAYNLVKILDTLTTRLRQQEREYLLIDVSPSEDITIHVLEGSNFSLIGANDVLVSEGKLVKGFLSLEPVRDRKEFRDFVSTALPPVVDSYLGDFAVRAERRRFVRAAEKGLAYYAVDGDTCIGALTLERVPGSPPATVFIGLIHPWENACIYGAALTAYVERIIVRTPLTEPKLRGELADLGFRPYETRLTYRFLL
jgi:hypothetical protein